MSEIPSAFMICQPARFEQPIVLTRPRLTQSSSARRVASAALRVESVIDEIHVMKSDQLQTAAI